MNALFEQLFVLYLFIFLGWGLGKRKKDAAEKSNVLSYLLVNLLFPCKIFLNYANHFTVSYIRQNYITLFVSTGILLVLVL
jgi:predicted permease